MSTTLGVREIMRVVDSLEEKMMRYKPSDLDVSSSETGELVILHVIQERR